MSQNINEISKLLMRHNEYAYKKLASEDDNIDDIIKLTKSQIIDMNKELMQYGGKFQAINDDILSNIVESPFQTYDNNQLYKTISKKAAKLCCSIIKYHPFTDGNKRTGIHVMLVFLQLNNIRVSYSNDDLILLALSIANNKIDVDDIDEWINKHKFKC